MLIVDPLSEKIPPPAAMLAYQSYYQSQQKTDGLSDEISGESNIKGLIPEGTAQQSTR